MGAGLLCGLGLVYLPTPKRLGAAAGHRAGPTALPGMANGPASQQLAGDPTLMLPGRGLYLRATAQHHRGWSGPASLLCVAPRVPHRGRCDALDARATPTAAQPGATPRVRQAPDDSAFGLSSDVPSGTPTTRLRERDQDARHRAGLTRTRRPRSLHGNRDRPPCWDRGPLGEPRVGPRATSSVPRATDGESRHGAVTCPALDPGPVHRCGWLCAPGSCLHCPPSSARPCCPCPSLIREPRPGLARPRSWGRGQEHQVPGVHEGPKPQAPRGAALRGKCWRQEAGQGQNRTLKIRRAKGYEWIMAAVNTLV